MTIEQFLADYTGYCIGAFGLGWSIGALMTFAKKFFEKI